MVSTALHSTGPPRMSVVEETEIQCVCSVQNRRIAWLPQTRRDGTASNSSDSIRFEAFTVEAQSQSQSQSPGNRGTVKKCSTAQKQKLKLKDRWSMRIRRSVSRAGRSGWRGKSVGVGGGKEIR